ncbi:MAG TPA: aspartate--tRNA ligase, partial [Acidobacteriota bacterium]|nr:aspartate--tRNA ligase [Acidobacteriota bacterium]
MLKTHDCGELRLSDNGSSVALAGWLQRRRDHGGLIFLDLRDRSGIVQVTADPGVEEAYSVAEKARNEYVIHVKGKVRPRPDGMVNRKMATGEIEVLASSIEIINAARAVPIPIDDDGYRTEEATRLKYRYLDLRRSRLQRNIILRHKTIKFIRDYLDARGFLEIETPMLIKSTPEGARDYVVPSRVQPGKFFALPQSPQQLKQLLMVAGYEKYFQIARCMRDEDLRGDRQPEFTQLDLEMSFVERDDILEVVEGLITGLIPAVTPGKRIFSPFPRMSCAEAMARYGTDKPDLRFGMEIADITEAVRATGAGYIAEAIAAGRAVKCIVAPGCASYSRKETDMLAASAREAGAANCATLAWTADGMKGSIARQLKTEEIAAISAITGAGQGDLAC